MFGDVAHVAAVALAYNGIGHGKLILKIGRKLLCFHERDTLPFEKKRRGISAGGRTHAPQQTKLLLNDLVAGGKLFSACAVRSSCLRLSPEWGPLTRLT